MTLGRALGWLTLATLAASCNCGRAPTLKADPPIIRVDTELAFGPVQELTQKGLPLRVDNLGRAELALAGELEGGGSADFTIGEVPAAVAPGGFVEVLVTFRPQGAGVDEAFVVFTSDDPDQPTARVRLSGGPIASALSFDPEPLDFRPTAQALVTRQVALKSTGLASLTVTAVGVDPTGNPDFSVVLPALPFTLKPGEAAMLSVEYARSSRTAEGRVVVQSDDPVARSLSLIPDPAKACADGVDNEMDGLTDFPDDPGCGDAEDDDEFNPPQCINGATQPCGSTVGACRQGVRVCGNSIWGFCDGGVQPGNELCNGIDDNCNAVTDESVTEACTTFGCAGARACVPDAGVVGGQWTNCFPANAVNETCDGLDNDCDGVRDDGIVEACSAFGCAGTRLCIPDAGGVFTTCAANNPLPESCNGLDDNCNGTPDDGIVAQVCGVGECRRTALGCVDGGVPACVPGTQSAEQCNGLDDNCDGTVDQIIRACYSGAPATRGVGRCIDGTQLCVDGGWPVACSGEVLPAPAEVCGNGIDDNCVVPADEGCDAGTCNPDGTWTVTGPAFSYSCFFGLAVYSVSSFSVSTSGGGTTFTPLPQFRANPRATPPVSCPSGGIDAGAILPGGPGGCDEIYSIQGQFTGPDTFTGVLKLEFNDQGTGFSCLECVNQTFTFSAFR